GRGRCRPVATVPRSGEHAVADPLLARAAGVGEPNRVRRLDGGADPDRAAVAGALDAERALARGVVGPGHVDPVAKDRNGVGAGWGAQFGRRDREGRVLRAEGLVPVTAPNDVERQETAYSVARYGDHTASAIASGSTTVTLRTEVASVALPASLVRLTARVRAPTTGAQEA